MICGSKEVEFRGNWDSLVHADCSAPLSSQKHSLVAFIMGIRGIFNKALLKCPCKNPWGARDVQQRGEAVPGQ